MLLSNLNLLATAPGGVAKLRELILTLAVQGKLVPQDPADEPASVLLQKIRAEKDRLIAEGKIQRDKPLAEIAEEEKQFGLPQGWEWVRALDICALITDGDHQPPPKADTGVPFLVIGDVRTGAVLLQGASRFVSESYFEKLDWGKKPFPGDVLYTTVGSFGIPVPVVQQQRFCFQRHIALLRPAVVDLQSYLALALRTTLAFAQAEKGATGTAQKTVPLSVLRNLILPLPPLAEQSRIVTRVEALMRLCDALEAKGRLEAAQHAQLVSTLLGTLTASSTPDALAAHWQRVAQHFDLLLDRPEAIDALEQTLLQLAVRGLLVPQDPTDEPASALLQKIRAEKDRLIATGQIKRDKPLPPITDEEKPFELPVGWEWVRLQQAYDVRDGTHDTPKYQSTGFPLVTSKNLYGGVLDLSDVKLISPADHEQISARSRVNRDDILFAMIGSIGNPVIVDTDTEFSVKNVALFKYYAAALSCPKYLLLVLQAEAAGMKERAAGGVQSFISLGQLRSSVVALPPLSEQSRIVSRVTALRRLCADLRQRLAERQSVQARLAEALVANNAQTSTQQEDECHAA